jgi:hypothetical protein
MSKTLNIRGFHGMSNIQESGSSLTDKAGNVTPQIILNSDITRDLSLVKREGQTKKISLTDAKSLWSGSVMLCVSRNKLYRLEGSQATEICSVEGELSYAEVNGLIYISSKYFTCVYDQIARTVRDWGVALPGAPNVSIVSGDMPPGRYCLCYTRLRDDGQISGSGSIIEVEWSGDTAGIELLNCDSDCLAWITDTNGTDFFLATVESDKIISPHYDKPLPSLLCSAPPKMSLIAYAFGRIWGVSGKSLYYSEPSGYEWFKDSNCFQFGEEIVMIAPVQAGMYVSSMNTTWVLDGTAPDKMSMRIVGEGAVPGTLVYDEFQQSGQEITYWRHKSVLPVWMSRRGFVIGNEHLHIANLTEGRLDIEHGLTGAALSRKTVGVDQVLITMPVSLNDEIGNIFKMGRIFLPGPMIAIGTGGLKIT